MNKYHHDDRVITVLGSGRVTSYHPGCEMVAVALDADFGQQWFHTADIEIDESYIAGRVNNG